MWINYFYHKRNIIIKNNMIFFALPSYKIDNIKMSLNVCSPPFLEKSYRNLKTKKLQLYICCLTRVQYDPSFEITIREKYLPGN